MKKSLLFASMIMMASSLYAGEGRISAEIEMLNGKAGEYVYAPSNGDKISYLDWKIKNVPLLKLGYNYSVNNFEFSIVGKKNVSKNFRSSYMKDYDWFSTLEEGDEPIPYAVYDSEEEARANARPGDEIKEEDGQWLVSYVQKEEDRGKLSNFSKNKNYIKNIIGLDLSVKYYLKNTEKFKIAPVIGLNYDKYEFYALGGDQINYIPGIGGTLNEGDGKKAIEYKQRFITPYIGLMTTYIPNSKWEINFGIKGSTLGKARAIDKHLARGNMENVEKYKNMKYLSSNIMAKYNWNENLSVNLGIEAVKHFKNRKSTVRFTPEEITPDSTVETLKDVSGIKNHNISYSLGFSYKF